MDQVDQHGFAIGRVCVYQTQDIRKGVEQEMGFDLCLKQSQISLKGFFFTGKTFDFFLLDHLITKSYSCFGVEEVPGNTPEGNGQYNDLKKTLPRLIQRDGKNLVKDKKPYLHADQGPTDNSYHGDEKQRCCSLWLE